MYSKLFLFFIICSALGCSLFETKQNLPRKEIKDWNPSKAVDTGSPRKRLALLPFLDKNPNHPTDFKESSRRALMLDLNKSGNLIAMSADEFNLDLTKKLADGTYDMKELTKQTKDTGVSAFLVGQIVAVRIESKAGQIGIIRKLKTGIEVDVQVKVASIRGGKEIFNTVKTVRMEDENVRVAERVDTDRFVKANTELIQVMIKDAFLEFTSQIIASLDRITWEGRIAAVQGDRLFLNVGRISGLQVGDLLKVSEDGDDIYDPDSGVHIGKSPGRLKGTLEIISYFGTDGSIAVIHSGAGFKENDKVEVY
ncbi:MAG: hypothetical protein AABY64_00550 [Bdellovibrionota bacterium]|mgnify:CR=1 FL=1